MIKYLMAVFIMTAVSIANADELVWTATNGYPAAVMAKYYYDNVSTNLPQPGESKPWHLMGIGGQPEIDYYWTGDEGDKPTPAQLAAIDPPAAWQWYHAAMNPVQVNAASNIVALASDYGVTDQPIPWTAVALAMQAERADATASNDIMRLLTVVGDGTTMLSFKEFYTENGGDVLDVRFP